MLTDLRDRLSALQDVASDLHGEKEKVRGQQCQGWAGTAHQRTPAGGPRAAAVPRSNSCRMPSGSWG